MQPLVLEQAVPDLAQRRLEYARQVCGAAGVRSEPLLRAYATVPREHYLGPGPWRIIRPETFPGVHETTPDDDPAQLYQNVLIAIDEARELYNGEPLALARWFDVLSMHRGDRALHIGCGVGYYTAIMAEVVGPRGDMVAVEVDCELAKRARSSLGSYPHVTVTETEADTPDVGPRDVVFVNAGTTHPQQVWLDCLAPGGRLLFPLTVSPKGGALGYGHMLRVEHTTSGYTARFVSPVGIFNCAGRNRATELRLRNAYGSGDHESVKELRLDRHAEEETCWLHDASWCLSKRPTVSKR